MVITRMATIGMVTRMTEPPAADPAAGSESGAALSSAGLVRLLAWLSPSFPVGSFAYSGGLEWAVEAGDIRDAETLRRWLAALLADGGVFCDAALFAHAHAAECRGDAAALHAVAELAAALAPSRERFLETVTQGRAFVTAVRAAWPCAALDRLADWPDAAIAYPVAVAVAAAGHGVAVAPALHGVLHALVANLVSAAVRLVPLGQTDGLRVLAALEPEIVATAARALTTPLDAIGSATVRADIAGMRHETQYTRLFRS